ncbi:MAG: MucR family transcriptional regulator [Methanosarcinales archaeon]
MSKDKVICRICGKGFKWITHLHLKKHGMTTKEYKKKFKVKKLTSKDFSKKLSTSLKKLYASGKATCGFKKGHKTWNKGLTAETDERVKKNTENAHKTLRKRYASGEITVWNKNLRGYHLKPMLKIKCEICGKIVEVHPYYKNRRFCDRKCFAEWLKRGNSPFCYPENSFNWGEVKETNPKKYEKFVERMRRQAEEVGEKRRGKTYEEIYGEERAEEERNKRKLSLREYYQSHEVSSVVKKKVSKSLVRHPNNFEKDVIDEISKLGVSIRFTGDRSFWLSTPAEAEISFSFDGKLIKKSINKFAVNPDLIVEPFSETKAVIEVFGSKWHEPQEEFERIEVYKKIGIKCLIIWDYEFYPNKYIALRKVKKFLDSLKIKVRCWEWEKLKR